MTTPELMDNEHFHATQVPQTPLEIEAFCRLEALSLERCEDLLLADQHVERLEGEVQGLGEELEGAQKELDNVLDDLQAAENRIEELELELLNQGESE